MGAGKRILIATLLAASLGVGACGSDGSGGSGPREPSPPEIPAGFGWVVRITTDGASRDFVGEGYSAGGGWHWLEGNLYFLMQFGSLLDLGYFSTTMGSTTPQAGTYACGMMDWDPPATPTFMLGLLADDLAGLITVSPGPPVSGSVEIVAVDPQTHVIRGTFDCTTAASGGRPAGRIRGAFHFHYESLGDLYPRGEPEY